MSAQTRAALEAAIHAHAQDEASGSIPGTWSLAVQFDRLADDPDDDEVGVLGFFGGNFYTALGITTDWQHRLLTALNDPEED